VLTGVGHHLPGRGAVHDLAADATAGCCVGPALRPDRISILMCDTSIEYVIISRSSASNGRLASPGPDEHAFVGVCRGDDLQ
jgi:hypothetical protein